MNWFAKLKNHPSRGLKFSIALLLFPFLILGIGGVIFLGREAKAWFVRAEATTVAAIGPCQTEEVRRFQVMQFRKAGDPMMIKAEVECGRYKIGDPALILSRNNSLKIWPRNSAGLRSAAKIFAPITIGVLVCLILGFISLIFLFRAVRGQPAEN